jgi:hypothetical protein
MPMLISAEAAAEYMLKGILSSRSSVYFPRRFSFIVRLLNMLPERLQKRMCISMRQEPKRKRENAE